MTWKKKNILTISYGFIHKKKSMHDLARRNSIDKLSMHALIYEVIHKFIQW